MRFSRRGVATAIACAFLPVLGPTAATAADYSPSITAATNVGDDRVSASASADVDCIKWEATAVDFDGGTKSLPGGKSASVTFDAPDDDGTYHIRFVCTYDDAQLTSLDPNFGEPSGAVLLIPAAIQTVSTVAAFTVDGDDDSDDSDGSDDSDDSDGSDDSDDSDGSSGSASASGGLPGTGGPEQELLWIGLGLVGAGSAFIYAVRRRNANA